MGRQKQIAPPAGVVVDPNTNEAGGSCHQDGGDQAAWNKGMVPVQT